MPGLVRLTGWSNWKIIPSNEKCMTSLSLSVCVCVCLQQERTSPRKDGISITKQDNGRGKKLKNNSLPNSGVPSTPILFFFLPPEGSCLTFPTSFPFVSRYFSIGKILTATRTDQMDSDNNPGIRSRSWLGVWESVRGRIFEMFPSEWVCVRGGKKCFHTCKKIRLTLIMQTFFFFPRKKVFPQRDAKFERKISWLEKPTRTGENGGETGRAADFYVRCVVLCRNEQTSFWFSLRS